MVQLAAGRDLQAIRRAAWHLQGTGIGAAQSPQPGDEPLPATESNLVLALPGPDFFHQLVCLVPKVGVIEINSRACQFGIFRGDDPPQAPDGRLGHASGAAAPAAQAPTSD